MSDNHEPTAPAPASEATHKASHKPRRWPRYTMIGVGGTVVVLAGAFWLLGRESTLQALVAKVASASGGQIVVTGVSGSLYNKMHLGHVSYRSKTQTITADNIDINWSPFQYFSEGIAISELHVASLAVQSTGPSEPSKMPDSLAAPFQLSIADARIDKVTLLSAGGSNVIEKVHFNLSGGKTEWRIKDAGALTQWGAVAANATIAANKPFKLDGKASLTQLKPAAGEKPAALALQLGGDLNALNVNANGSAGPASADAQLVLAPFDPVIILRSANIKGHNINPGRYDATFPQAELSLDLTAAIGANQAVSGKLLINNAAPAGAIDQQRLPLRSLSAQVGGTLTATTIDSALLDFANAGKFTGSGSINRDAVDGPIGTALFTLHTDKIDLKAIHSSMNSTDIAGDIKLGSAGKTQTIAAQLAQRGNTPLRLDLQATLLDSLLTITQARVQAGKGQLNLTGQASLKDGQAFKVTANASRFNPADFGAYPVADLNADVRLDGHVAPSWMVNADVALRPSRLMNQPLTGSAKLSADATHVSGVQAALALGQNTIDVRGNFGAPGEKLNWKIDARQLSAAQSDLLGALQASGVVSGTMQQPRSTFLADAKGLGLTSAKRPAPDSIIHASGEIGLTGPQRVADLKLNGSVQKLNPAAFGAYPSGNINADFNGGGKLGNDWRMALNLALQPASTLSNAPLSGYAKVTADSKRIDGADIDLHVGPNSLQARGSFGAPQDKLNWKLDAPQLASLGPQFGGVLRGSGVLSGSMAAPALSLNLDGQQLRLMGVHQIKALRASASVGSGQGAADPLVSDIDITGYSNGDFNLASAHLSTKGTRAAHSLQLTARNDDFDASTSINGGWNAGAWTGSLATLQNRGRFALTLQAPVALRIAGAKDSGIGGLFKPEQISVGNAVIKLPAGSISLASLDKNGARWTSSGQAAGVPLSYLTQVAPSLQETLRSDMTLGAQWNMNLQAATAAVKEPALAGMLHVFREKGDITVGSEQPLALGLRTLDARFDVANNQLRLKVDLDGARSGQVNLAGTVQMREGRIAGDSALNLTGSANMPSLAWVGPLSGMPGLELGGALKLAIAGGGTIAVPSLTGDITGDKLVVNWADQGLKLRNGVLQAKLAGDQLQLQRLSFDGGDGKVQADGWVRFANAEASMELKLVADKLQALARPDRTLVVSGTSTLIRNEKRFSFDGKFKADRALIELAPQDTPTQSDDVVVLGKPSAASKGAPSLPLNIDLEADLGNRFHLRGMGLDADLAGTLRIRVLDRRPPRINGSIRVDNGNYAAYGQKLSIERGVINFTGAYDNPGLNILAVRKRPEGEALSDTNVEAGVEVRGTAQAPTAKLVSTPSVSDSDKLAWLVLGHGTEGTAGDEMGLLTTAAGALFGGTGGGMQGKLANSLGLDEVGLSQAKGLESTVVTVGKRISSRAYVSFEQGASSASSLVKLRYKLNRRITLQFQTGTNNALDVLYTWAFD